MSDTSAILSLPYLQPAQAQKHVTHNEALQLLDVLVQMAVIARTLSLPPASPVDGERYIVGPGAGGEWAGKSGEIACFQAGAWRFITPMSGWQTWVLAEDIVLTHISGTWQEGTARLMAKQLGINATPDSTNRLSLSADATLLNNAGAGHQLKINKAGVSDTASLLLQDNWSGRAEIGLTGSDDLAVKVSADGSAWVNAISVAASNGMVTVPSLKVLTGLDLPTAGVARSALASATALSVIGNSSNLAATPDDIVAASNYQVLRRSGAALGFGAVALNQSAAVTGALSAANGGTGVANSAAATLTRAGAFPLTVTLSAASNVTLPPGTTTLVGQSNLLGTVSQTSGVPSGAVIERGSNSNGSYVRFADGTQICDARIVVKPGTDTTAGVKSVQWTYPATFVNASTEVSLTFTIISSRPDLRGAATGGTNSAFGTIYYNETVGTNTDVTAKAMAIGRWF